MDDSWSAAFTRYLISKPGTPSLATTGALLKAHLELSRPCPAAPTQIAKIF